MRPNRQFPKGLPHNACWTALDSLSIGKAIDCLVHLASPRYEANAPHPIDEMSSKWRIPCIRGLARSVSLHGYNYTFPICPPALALSFRQQAKQFDH
ncbi:hypothetical protein UNDKW_3724 [Undibacterium sp. KW1]|nr:hypothetical protein UNDKW_3724 [Undibacterium sp. KW1]